MAKQNFFAISNACLEIHEENTRSSFINTLPKSFQGSLNLNLALETAIFDNDFNSYKSENESDMFLSFEGENYFISFHNVNNLTSLVRRCNEFFSYISDRHRMNRKIAEMTLIENKIRLELISGFVAMTPTFFNFLNLRNHLDEQDFVNEEFSLKLYVLKFETDEDIFVYVSETNIHLNSEQLKFIYIAIEGVEKYPALNSNTNIISLIPLDTSSPTTYFSPSKKNYFKFESNILKTISVKFLQPSLHPVYFNFGSPNIIKMSIQTDIRNQFFYTQVSSRATPSFNDNNCNHFQIELPKEFTLEGDWEVGVVNAFIPNPSNVIKFDTTVYKIPRGSNFFMLAQATPINRKKYVKFPLLEFTKRELCIFLLREFSEFLNVFMSNNERIFLTLKRDNRDNTYTHIVTSEPLLALINSKGHLKEISATAADVIWKDRFQQEKEKFVKDNMDVTLIRGMTIIRGYEKMKDWVKGELCFFEGREFYNLFNIDEIEIDRMDIKRILSLSESHFLKKEELRILKIFQNQRLEGEAEIIPSFFFIYCDFVSETIMGDKFINLLKMIPYKSGANNLPGGSYDFSRSEFYPVNRHILKNLSFYIKTHSGSQYSYFSNNSHIDLTLKFQRIR